VSLAVLVATSALYAGGTWLLISRSLLRVILGVALVGHGSVLLLVLAAGEPGAPAFADDAAGAGAVTDPLPQALGLTAIVITFALVAFLLALAWRSKAVLDSDHIPLDREDRRIASLGAEAPDVAVGDDDRGEP
jgi:multicomponent Na+:H+ antiporter subunit C